MRGIRVLFSVLLGGILIVNGALADYEQSLEYTESKEPIQAVEEHHRSKRSPYDPLIPALLLGKSAFLLGTVLGPRLLHRPHRQRPQYHHRSYHGGHGDGGYSGGYGGYSGGYGGYSGGHGGYSGGHGGGYSQGWGWK